MDGEAGFGHPHTRHTVARVGGYLLMGGGSLSFLLMLLDENYTRGNNLLVAGTSGIALLLGAYCFLLPNRAPRILLCSIPIGAGFLICIPMFASRTPTDGSEMMLVWPVLFSSYFLSRPVAWLNVIVVISTYVPVAIHVEGVTVGLTPSVHLAGTSIVTMLVVASMRMRLSRLIMDSRQEARTDGLTGLLNRRAYDEMSAQVSARCARDRTPLAMLLVDLDFFKRLNDTHGHQAGDDALRQVAILLRAQTRASDVLARFGGEEFAILMPACPLHDAVHRAEAVRALIARSAPYGLTASIGVGVSPDHADGPDRLVAVTDAALYVAKDNGRNRVQIARMGHTQPKSANVPVQVAASPVGHG